MPSSAAKTEGVRQRDFKEIAAKLAEQGFDVDKKKIILKDALKTLGDYTCEVRLMEGVSAKIFVSVVPE